MFSATFYLVPLVVGKMKVFILIFKRQIIVYIAETSSKIASMLSQKWLTIFVKRLKILNILDHTILLKISRSYYSDLIFFE